MGALGSPAVAANGTCARGRESVGAAVARGGGGVCGPPIRLREWELGAARKGVAAYLRLLRSRRGVGLMRG